MRTKYRILTRRTRNGYRAFVVHGGHTLAWTLNSRANRNTAFVDGAYLVDDLRYHGAR